MIGMKQEDHPVISKLSDCCPTSSMCPKVIAIDGPAGAGKSTVARRVASRLGFSHIDTGAMYRALTWSAQRRDLDLDNQSQIVTLLGDLAISLRAEEIGNRIWVNGQEVTEFIRDPAVSKHVSRVARHPEVRAKLVAMQQDLAQAGAVVMDGRDIGTHVLPNAPLKIFLTASIEERAHRRLAELRQKGIEKSLEEMTTEIAQRDQIDSQREASPLVKADDAVEIDTSDLSIDQVVDKIASLAEIRGITMPTGE